jgi:hypothetical protein
MCAPRRWLRASAKTCSNHFYTFILIYTRAISLNKSYSYIANCTKLIKFQFPIPFLNDGKEMPIFIICVDDVNK